MSKKIEILEANLNATGNKFPVIVQSVECLTFADFALTDLPANLSEVIYPVAIELHAMLDVARETAWNVEAAPFVPYTGSPSIDVLSKVYFVPSGPRAVAVHDSAGRAICQPILNCGTISGDRAREVMVGDVEDEGSDGDLPGPHDQQDPALWFSSDTSCLRTSGSPISLAPRTRRSSCLRASGSVSRRTAAFVPVLLPSAILWSAAVLRRMQSLRLLLLRAQV